MVSLSDITSDDSPLLNVQINGNEDTPANSGVYETRPITVAENDTVTITPSDDLGEPALLDILTAVLTVTNASSVKIELYDDTDTIVETIVVSVVDEGHKRTTSVARSFQYVEYA